MISHKVSLARRLAAGGVIGGVFGAALLSFEPSRLAATFVAIVFGMAFTAFHKTSASDLNASVAGSMLGFLIWIAYDLLGNPLYRRLPIAWTPAGMHATLPLLAGWMLAGLIVGYSINALLRIFHRVFASSPKQTAAPRPASKHVLIVGGGFAGMETAASLERILRDDRSIEVTLISATNALLFTPMLSEVAGGSVEPSHISSPARTMLRRTAFLRARVSGIDFDRKIVTAEGNEVAYDQLVLALGSVSNYLGLEGVERWSLGFKTLTEAIAIRNRIVAQFDLADRESDPELRRRHLTFVIAGGGFAGAELAGALNDFARGMLPDYADLSVDDVAVMVVHSGDRILPELSASLAAYALKRMTERGVTFRLGTRVQSAGESFVQLNDGTRIATNTLIWTAGTTPSPLLANLDLNRDKRGAAIVDETLAVAGKFGVWCVGDCAAVIDTNTNAPCPPTAQFALREAKTVAHNVYAVLHGKPAAAFHFTSLGALCVVGYQTACAELVLPVVGRAVYFSGFLAWILWRAIYLAKLPGAERKIRVLIDWTVELFFSRDIVQTVDPSS